ncbi:MAG TPA: Ig-like domain-containing protein [Novosphingobium sp.]|nr:Ig-like domain-containing protein [Novosphingobium sp.]
MTSYLNALGQTLSDQAATSNSYYGAALGATLNGSSGNDRLRGNGVGDTLAGGLGNDTYYVNSSKDIVVEQANAGNDTVISYVNKYTLTANVENLVLTSASWYGAGNSLNNVITATAAHQSIYGGGGNDVLVSTSTDTTFIVNKGDGSDAIYGFDSTDQVRLTNYNLHSFSDVQAIMSQVGADTWLNLGGGEKLVLRNTQASSLTASNFLVELDTSGMKQTFGDEFNSLSLVQTGGTWATRYGIAPTNSVLARTLATNGEQQIYMDQYYSGSSSSSLNINPFSISNGVLTITAAPTPTQDLQYLSNYAYTSGLLTTRQSFSQEYGYFEIKAKLPSGTGFWPAFWLLPADGSWPPEIDVFETGGSDPNTALITTHWTNSSKANLYEQDKVNVDTTQWHTYGVNWGPNTITYYIDGVAVAEIATPDSLKGKEMYMLLDLAVGGWSGTPTSGATAQMLVDYVHAYATSDTVSTTINGVHTTYTPSTVSSGVTTSTPVISTPVYIAPLAAADSFAAHEGSALTISASSGVLANDTHDVSLTLAASVKTGPAHGTLSLAADGSFVYTPTAGYHGTDSFTYLATDSSGQTSTATATITVAQVNPVAHDNSLSTAYSTPTTITSAALLANDTIDTGYALTITGVSGASHGTVAMDSNGLITFTPDAFFSGTASFTYTVSDAYGDSSQGTVNVSVAAETAPKSTYILGTSGADVIDKHASSYGWQIAGGAGNDILMGGAGSNSLNGGAGNDIIIGGTGNDTITGGAGADVMTGNGGADTFVFNAGDLVSISSGSADRITDFLTVSNNPHDMIRFQGFDKWATFTLASTNADGSFTYHLSDGAYSGDIIIQSGGTKLTSADYVFA